MIRKLSLVLLSERRANPLYRDLNKVGSVLSAEVIKIRQR
jgi:hypothetical protein